MRDLEKVFGLAASFIVPAGTCTDAAEIRPRGDVAQVVERLRERGDDLVVLGPALYRVGMGDQRDTAPQFARVVEVGFDRAAKIFESLLAGEIVKHVVLKSALQEIV